MILFYWTSLALITVITAHNAAELAKIAANFPDQDPIEMLKIKDGLRMLNEQSRVDAEAAVIQDAVALSDSSYDGPRSKEVNELDVNKDISDYFYQGDIMLSSDEVYRMISGRSKRNTIFGDQFKWETDRPIPVVIDRTVSPSNARLIRAALKIWEDNTCLSFQEVSGSSPHHYLKFLGYGGCSSSVGKQPGAYQTVHIDTSCNTVGIILHELGHALGMHHTQSRYDRDGYVQILNQNIIKSMLYNFQLESTTTNYNYGVEYDYGSIMHYYWNAFSIDYYNNLPTIIAKDPNQQKTMGQRKHLAFSDIWLINLHHKCTDKCARYRTPCENGGFAHPRDCNKCICPEGFTGRYCNERKGSTVVAATNWQKLTGKIGSAVFAEIPEVKNYYHITAPNGRKIEIRVNDVGKNTDRCEHGDVIVNLKDARYAGYRFCGPKDGGGKTFTSTANQVGIVLRSKFEWQTMDIDYRLLP